MLTVGLLEPGRENSGVRRYGEVIANALRECGGVTIREVCITPARRGPRGLQDALEVVSAMRDVDVAIIPYTRTNIWSPSASRLLQLLMVHLGLRRRTLTVLHDVYPPGRPQRVEWWVNTLVFAASGGVVVHSEEERRELRLVPRSGSADVVPHFVLERDLPDRDQARVRLGVPDGTKVVGMVGFINPRKNYELAVESLALLPENVELWVIGAAGLGLDWYAESIAKLAEGKGVRSRIRITGSVSEEELDLRLAAVDVGVCPYRRISASGSMSTLLGARRPVIASDVEFARELQAVAPTVVHTLETLNARTLATKIMEVVTAGSDPRAFEPILAQRSISATASRYRDRLDALLS